MYTDISVYNICNLNPKSYILCHITEIEVFKPFLEHELYLSNEAVMDHLPSSSWNVLLKINPFFNAYSIFFFFFFLQCFIFFIDNDFFFSEICLFILAWKQIGSGMLGSGNKQDAQCEHDSF